MKKLALLLLLAPVVALAGPISFPTKPTVNAVHAGTNVTITGTQSDPIISASAGAAGVSSINADSTGGQTLAVGSSGTNFAIVDAGGGAHTLNLPTADGTHTGKLAAADWTTFNGKQASGSYLTALTGDATAAGPGSAAITLATVNSNVGSFGDATHVAVVTLNGKGLVTAGSSVAIQLASTSAVTGLDTALSGKLATDGSNAGASFALYGATPVVQASAITAPTGGAVIDSQCRTAVSSILTALGSTSGVGITAN